ncbi:hypothetical protein VNO77_20887 [Canavalia gladiata]|uniref:Uncharacterized protein n=1 Tax=Canavalia gladiata TaxID=3824 RepID=A0AAN9QMV9_CANGL
MNAMTTPPKKSKLAIPVRLRNLCIHGEYGLENYLFIKFEDKSVLDYGYGASLFIVSGVLVKLKASLLLDIHSHDQVETLLRSNLSQSPYPANTRICVGFDLHMMMANAFKTTVGGLEKEREADYFTIRNWWG